MNEKTITRGTWLAAFTVASVWFGTHVGAGFATGAQVVSYFVKYGWTAAVFPILSMGLLAYVMFVIMRFCRLRGIDNYKDGFRELWQPYPQLELTFELFYIIIILAAVAAAISGAANLLVSNFGLPSLLSSFIIVAILILLSIFGVKLIIAASTFLSTAILIVAGVMIVVGLSQRTDVVATALATPPVDVGDGIWRGIIIYAAFQCVSIPAMISAATTLNQKGVKKAAILGAIMNGGMLALSGLMLLGWYPEISAAQAAGVAGASIPNLFVCQTIGWDWLIAMYSILLFCASVSTCVTLIYTMIARFEGYVMPKTITNDKVRKVIVGGLIIGICMAISFLGITQIVTMLYGYDGYLSLVVIVVPVIIIGNIKNKKFIAANPGCLDK